MLGRRRRELSGKRSLGEDVVGFRDWELGERG